MSLLDDYTVACTRLKAVREPDGEGGMKTAWKDGDDFTAAIAYDSSLAAKKAEREGVTALYTVTVDKDLTFAFHDVFRRNLDGKIFRATTDGGDKQTPARASFQKKQFRAEEWKLPVDGG